MTTSDTQNSVEIVLPSRTSILVAAVRAFGSREPDECVRNPDSVADLLIGPAELALISDHPVSGGLAQDYEEASQNPAIMMFAGLMLWRTRFIDEALERAVTNGATQVVVLGAGFDSRAYRFSGLLANCRVIEVDAAPTQIYKRRRILEALGGLPANLTYCTMDFATDDLMAGLRGAGLNQDKKTIYIWEGVSMYLPEDSVRNVLHTIAAHSAAGSTLVLDYVNRPGIEFGKHTPSGPGGIPAQWAEPWIFGVPEADGADFFRELGFDPGMPLSLNNPETVRRYGTRRDGTSYAARALEKLRALAVTQARPNHGFQEAQRAVASAGGAYWLTELTVRDRKIR